jgi:cytochrome d ubiquinol oxidase subunit I
MGGVRPVRTAEAVTPSLTLREATISLVVLVTIYSVIFVAGATYIYRLLRAGPIDRALVPIAPGNPMRPLAGSPGIAAEGAE